MNTCSSFVYVASYLDIEYSTVEIDLYAALQDAQHEIIKFIKKKINDFDLQNVDSNLHEDYYSYIMDAINNNDFNELITQYNNWMMDELHEDTTAVVIITLYSKAIEGSICNCKNCLKPTEELPVKNKTSYPNGMFCKICNQ